MCTNTSNMKISPVRCAKQDISRHCTPIRIKKRGSELLRYFSILQMVMVCLPSMHARCKVRMVTQTSRLLVSFQNSEQLLVQECYRCLPDKTLAFFMLVHKRYNAKWVAKIDDDVYLTPNRLLRVLAQWDSINADYVGCMKTNEVCT